MISKISRIVLLGFVATLLLPAASFAQIGWRGWGPRVGISSDPDQVFAGAQFDLGTFGKNTRFQPSAEIGFGDHTTTLAGNFMVSYYFPVQAEVTPYAGGQLTVAYYDFDSDCGGYGNSFVSNGLCDSSSTEIGLMGVGGIETKLSGGTRFLAELNVGFGDVPDVKILAGWIFQ